MDGDIGTLIQSVLSDPEQMAKISQMAQGLMASAPETAASESAAGTPEIALPSLSEGEGKLLSSLGSLFSKNAGKSRSTALLVAMRPYMKPEKQEKLDRAMKIAQMAHIAGAVMREYGGGSHGI